MAGKDARSPSKGASSRPGEFDLLEHLEEFLRRGPPLTFLIKGESGTGKSTFLRTLISRVKGPRMFLVYRTSQSPQEGPPPGAATPEISPLLVFDPYASVAEPAEDASTTVDQSMAGSLAVHQASAPSTDPLSAALDRFVGRGPGIVVLDVWDPKWDQVLRALTKGGGAVTEVAGAIPSLRTQLRQLATRAVMSVPPEGDAAFLSMADGVVELGREEFEGFALRVISILKLGDLPTPEPRYLYSLHNGVFSCPSQLPAGFRPPLGPPDADPDPTEGTLFPGSREFAEAFGRFRYHGLTGFEVPPRFSYRLSEVFLIPLVAHTLNSGGRVAWIPSATSGTAQLCSQLRPFVPPDFLRERLRVLSLGVGDSSVGEYRSVVLPIRREAGGPAASTEGQPGIGPLFSEAFDFLRGTAEGKASLYVVSLDGLEALAVVADVPLDASTFPFVVGTYARLPGFHGVGFGRSDDPLAKVLLSSVETHIRVEERHGRTLVLGVRPRTNPFLLDWSDPSGKYALLPLL